MSLLPHPGHVLELEIHRKKPIGPCPSGTPVGEEHYHRRMYGQQASQAGPLNVCRAMLWWNKMAEKDWGPVCGVRETQWLLQITEHPCDSQQTPSGSGS